MLQCCAQALRCAGTVARWRHRLALQTPQHNETIDVFYINKEYFLQERINLWCDSNFYEKSEKIFQHNQLTHWYSAVKLISSYKTYNWSSLPKPRMALSRFQHLDIFMCRRSAEGIQKYIRPNCKLDLTYDVTGVNGCVFGVSDLQPSCAAPRSAIQGPAGTFTWRFLQARCLEEWLWIQYIWCMWKKIFVARLLGCSCLGFMREVCKGWKHAVSIVFHSVIT